MGLGWKFAVKKSKKGSERLKVQKSVDGCTAHGICGIPGTPEKLSDVVHYLLTTIIFKSSQFEVEH